MPGRSRKCRAPSGTEARRKPIQNHTDVFEQNVATHCSLDQQTGCSARARNSGMVLSFLRCCCSGKQAIRNTTFAKCIRETSSSRSEEHTSELQSRLHLVCRLLLEKK